MREIQVQKLTKDNFEKYGEFLDLLDEYSVDTCIFGHLHGGDATLFQNFSYHNKKLILVSADKLDFSPLKLYSLESNSDTVRYISASV